MVTTSPSLESASPNRRRAGQALANRPLGSYFGIAFGSVWLALLPSVLGRNGLGWLPFTVPDWAFVILFIGGTLLGPTLGAFAVTIASAGAPGVRALLRRYVQWRVGIRWYALALFGPIALNLIAVAIWRGSAIMLAAVAHWSLLFSVYLPALIGMILFPALLEEPGWRGFALPRLQRRYGPLRGTLILGALHGIWHLPVYFLVDAPAAMGPFNPGRVILNTLAIVMVSVCWTWVFNHAAGSVLIAILLHAANNAATGLMQALVPDLPPQFGPTVFALYLVVAGCLIIATRGRLGYTAAPSDSPAGPSVWPGAL